MNIIKKFLIGAAAGAMLLANTVMPAGAVTLNNGGFELNDISGNFVTVNSVDTTSIPNWTVATGSVDHIDDYWQPSEGEQSLDLNGNEPGSITQTFTTVIGATYTVTFDMSGNPDGAPAIKTLTVAATGDATPDVYSYDTVTEANTKVDMKWDDKTYTFVATATSTVLTFASTTTGSFGPALDNVVISENPSTVTVTIDKFIDGSKATATSANNSAFPMSATWNATNIGAGTGNYDLDADGFNGNPTPYQAITSNMTSGADYSTNEITGGSVVGADCTTGQPYALVGYTTGNTLSEAQGGTPNMSIPSFTNILSNKNVIVWNITCPVTTPTPTPINPFDVPAQCNQTIAYNLIEGTNGSEVINGTSGNDLILAKGGSDVVNGKEGDDCIVGGNGSDALRGDGGNDVILGGADSDSITGGTGNDDLHGEDGSDALNGNAGDDDLFGGAGSDSLKGEGGNDTLDGEGGSDAANGGANTDTCTAEAETQCEL